MSIPDFCAGTDLPKSLRLLSRLGFYDLPFSTRIGMNSVDRLSQGLFSQTYYMDRPGYLVYGAFGYAVSHEITVGSPFKFSLLIRCSTLLSTNLIRLVDCTIRKASSSNGGQIRPVRAFKQNRIVSSSNSQVFINYFVFLNLCETSSTV